MVRWMKKGMWHQKGIAYLQHSTGQQRGIYALLLIIICAGLCYVWMPYLIPSSPTHSQTELSALIRELQIMPVPKDSFPRKLPAPAVLTPFPFDPNTLDEAGFLKLGLRAKLVSTILNYRSKGGKFYHDESLKRIYGLHPDEFTQLQPFIRIEGEKSNRASIPIIELNTCDTTQLIALNGIGSKLSMSIIRYREQLGGFTQVAQLKEVYGISTETFQKIKPYLSVKKSLVKKLNLNEATYYELNAHPYLKGDIAKALVEFRKAHDYHIDHIDQIKEIELINEQIFRKIVPYLQIR
jgi:competence protein ComEA